MNTLVQWENQRDFLYSTDFSSQASSGMYTVESMAVYHVYRATVKSSSSVALCAFGIIFFPDSLSLHASLIFHTVWLTSPLYLPLYSYHCLYHRPGGSLFNCFPLFVCVTLDKVQLLSKLPAPTTRGIQTHSLTFPCMDVCMTTFMKNANISKCKCCCCCFTHTTRVTHTFAAISLSPDPENPANSRQL